ncbi:MAG: hypothetical protein H0X24_08855 [Ktedonobacterales bacterium]|nr:hypothetical protein [Ktedonobacterales bacterium]
MNDLTRPQRAYTIPVMSIRQRELARIYESAELALDPAKLYEWLERQPDARIVSDGTSAIGCMLATYLLAATSHLWCVSQAHFWRFDLARALAWRLPPWAVTLEGAELRLGTPITLALGRGLVRRAVPNLALALTMRAGGA